MTRAEFLALRERVAWDTVTEEQRDAWRAIAPVLYKECGLEGSYLQVLDFVHKLADRPDDLARLAASWLLIFDRNLKR